MEPAAEDFGERRHHHPAERAHDEGRGDERLHQQRRAAEQGIEGETHRQAGGPHADEGDEGHFPAGWGAGFAKPRLQAGQLAGDGGVGNGGGVGFPLLKEG